MFLENIVINYKVNKDGGEQFITFVTLVFTKGSVFF